MDGSALVVALPPPDHGLAKMATLADLIVSRASGEVLYKSGAEVIGHWLFTEPPRPGDPLWPGGAVQVVSMEAGQAFDVHSHFSSVEILVVLSGIMEVATFGADPLRVSPGEEKRLLPGEIHSARAVTGCVVIGITVPPDRGYPDAPGPEPDDTAGPG
jgi:quercetin dioxygenase-like cupin family protein